MQPGRTVSGRRIRCFAARRMSWGPTEVGSSPICVLQTAPRCAAAHRPSQLRSRILNRRLLNPQVGSGPVSAFEGSGVPCLSLVQDRGRSESYSRIRSTAINWTIPVVGLNDRVQERRLRKLNRGWHDLFRLHIDQIADLFADQSQKTRRHALGSVGEWPAFSSDQPARVRSLDCDHRARR